MDYVSHAESRIGTTLRDKWTLESLLGVGGMAAVYVAVHKIGRRDAIKILHAKIAGQPDLRARFEQEALAANRFKHPGAVEIRDIDVAEDGSPFLVMELLKGESLGERALRTDGIEESELLRLLDELLDVLAAAHAEGIVHRDIKLDNLLVLTDGRLKVLDFGIARMRDGLPVKMHTRTGEQLGTAAYMPPEQIKGLDIDGRADLFAVGATLFRLIAKRRIHEAANVGEMLAKMASVPPPPLATVAPVASPGLCLVVDRALKLDRDLRYPNALTMQADVRALRSGDAPPYATAHAHDPELPPTSAMASTQEEPPVNALTGDEPTEALPPSGLPSYASMPSAQLFVRPSVTEPEVPPASSSSRRAIAPMEPTLKSSDPSSRPATVTLAPAAPLAAEAAPAEGGRRRVALIVALVVLAVALLAWALTAR